MRVAHQQRADAFRFLPARRFQNCRHVEHLVAFISLRNDGALIRRLNGFEHFDRTKAELRQTLRSQADGHARRARRRFDLHVGGARNGREDLGNFLRLLVEQVEVVAKNADDHLCRFAGDCFADAIAEEGEHFGLDARKFFQSDADFVLHFGFLPGWHRIEFDVKFAAMGSPGVFAHLRPSDLLLDRFDMRILQQLLCNALAHPQHLRQRRSRSRGDLKDEMPFAE